MKNALGLHLLQIKEEDNTKRKEIREFGEIIQTLLDQGGEKPENTKEGMMGSYLSAVINGWKDLDDREEISERLRRLDQHSLNQFGNTVIELCILKCIPIGEILKFDVELRTTNDDGMNFVAFDLALDNKGHFSDDPINNSNITQLQGYIAQKYPIPIEIESIAA